MFGDDRGGIQARKRADDGGGGGGADAAASANAAADAALARLWAVAREAERCLCYRPPQMEAYWHPQYASRCSQALMDALAQGAHPDDVFPALRLAARELPDGAPWPLLRACIAAGLHADTDVGGRTPLLHHLIARPHPPPLQDNTFNGKGAKAASGSESGSKRGDSAAAAAAGNSSTVEEQCPVSLQRLLATATPDLTDSRGSTALHVLVRCLLERAHFPPAADDEEETPCSAAPTTAGPCSSSGGIKGQNDAGARDQRAGDAGGAGGTGNSSSHSRVPHVPDPEGDRWRDGHAFLAQAAADADRAVYARAAFLALLAAGWSVTARNKRGNSVSDLLTLAVAQCRADLEEIRDPRGLPRAALAEFVAIQGGGPERVAELAAAHEAGAQAVADAMRAMCEVAAARRRPGVARAVAVMVALWAVLLAVAWQVLVKSRGAAAGDALFVSSGAAVLHQR